MIWRKMKKTLSMRYSPGLSEAIGGKLTWDSSAEERNFGYVWIIDLLLARSAVMRYVAIN